MKGMFEREKERLDISVKEGCSVLLKGTEVPEHDICLQRPLFEVRVARPTPVKYYQDLFVDGERWPIVWRHDSFRGLTVLKDGSLLLYSKHPEPYEESYTHYLEARIENGRYRYAFGSGDGGEGWNGFIRISFDGELYLMDIITKKVEKHHVVFNFINHPFHYVSVRESVTMKIRETQRGQLGKHLSKFENYVVTVPHYSLHPYILNSYKECGYKRRTDLQKDGPAFFFYHLTENGSKLVEQTAE